MSFKWFKNKCKLIFLSLLIIYQEHICNENDTILNSNKTELYITKNIIKDLANINNSHLYHITASRKKIQNNDFLIIDSLRLNMSSLHDLTFGDGCLWIIKSTDWQPDTIIKINPINNRIVEIFEIPGDPNELSMGIIYDSISKNGPYLWISIDSPISKIKKIRIKDKVNIETYDSPDPYPYGIALRNDTMWIAGAYNNRLYTIDLKTKKFTALDTLPKYFVYGMTFNNDYQYLLLTNQHDPLKIYSDENYLLLIDPNSGKIIHKYISPCSLPFGICWENETIDGPYFWITNSTDFDAGITEKYLYKVTDPIIKSNIYKDIYNKQKYKIFCSPNPFTEKTKIQFNLDHPAQTKLTIYNLLGYEIEVLVDEYLPDGNHEAIFDGAAFPAGAYFFVLRAGSRIETGRMIRIGE